LPGEKSAKIIGTGEKLNVISRLESGERIVDMWHNVRFAYSSVYKIHDNADRITENA
jgi:tRNA1(Val) A37 N6-methylase TrmN6